MGGAARAVVFDLDDTLYPERQFVASGYRAVAEALRRQTGRDDRFEDWLWSRFLDGRAAGAFDALDEEFALGLSPAAIRDLVDAYRTHWPAIRPFDGIREILAALRRRGVRLGVLSDGPSTTQRNKLAALGLAGWFDAIVISGDFGPTTGKPQRRMFEMASVRLGVPGAECLYVADNPAKDFGGAAAMSWRTVQVWRGGQVHAGKAAPPGGRPERVVSGPELGRILRAATETGMSRCACHRPGDGERS